MAELARGTVNDRPWGRTFASLGLRGMTGQLTIVADGKSYAVAFSHGAVVAAISPLAADAAVRVALTGGLVTSTQVADIARRQQAAPDRDEIDVIAELARLGPEQALRLRRRVVAQRAARTFSIERGDFMVEDEVSLDVVPGSELDVRAVVYLGARYNVSDQRLATGVGQFGSWFKIKPDALLDLPQFGFGDDEQPVIALMLDGAELQELEVCAPELEQRMVRAMVYALVACNACDTNAIATPRAATPPPVAEAPRQPVARGIPPPGSRVPQATVRGGPTQPEASQPPARRTASGASTPAVAPEASPRTASQTLPPRTASPTAPPRTASPAPSRATASPTAPPRSTAPLRRDATPLPTRPTPQPGASARSRPAFRQSSTTPDASAELELAPLASAARTASVTNVPPLGQRQRMVADPHDQIAQVHALIAARARLVDDRADHYTMLNVDSKASAEVIRKAYFAIARQLHPDRLSALGIPDEDKRAQRLFAHVNTAFGVLSTPARRGEYDAILKRGGESAIRAEDAAAEQMALKILEAEEAFRRGEQAMRRNQIADAITEFRRAMELNPEESDYNALLAWALFCHATDKQAAGQTVRRALTTSIRKSPNSVAAKFYLGRVERMLGRDEEALIRFREVLDLVPNHAEATSEIRHLDTRLNPTQRSKR